MELESDTRKREPSLEDNQLAKLDTLKSMGFDQDLAQKTLEACQYNLSQAVSQLVLGNADSLSRDQQLMCAMEELQGTRAQDVTQFDQIVEVLKQIVANLCRKEVLEKHRRIRKSNSKFQTTIGTNPPALAFLRAMGMAEDVSGQYLELQRNDPELLWMAKSLLEDVVSG